MTDRNNRSKFVVNNKFNQYISLLLKLALNITSF